MLYQKNNNNGACKVCGEKLIIKTRVRSESDKMAKETIDWQCPKCKTISTTETALNNKQLLLS